LSEPPAPKPEASPVIELDWNEPRVAPADWDTTERRGFGE
jgi:hypothetical protein